MLIKSVYVHRDYTLEVGFNVSFKDFKALGTECEGMDSEEPAIYMTRKNEKSRLVKRKSASCKGRLKSIFLFLVQKAPQLIKQGRSAQCQLPVLGQYSTQADRSDSVPHSGNALHFPM